MGRATFPRASDLVSRIQHLASKKKGIMATAVKENKTSGKDLAQQECKPCKGGTPPLKGEELKELHGQLSKGWKVVDGHHLEKDFEFKDFRQALDFTNEVGELAESVNHHPDIYLAWGAVKLTLWTHTIDGLSESDFVFAAKVDEIKK